MTAMPTIEVLDLTEIVGEMEIPCDFSDQQRCSKGAARWIMHRDPCCAAKLYPALACDHCKDDRLMNRISVECYDCGKVWPDACEAYTYIEPLRGKS